MVSTFHNLSYFSISLKSVIEADVSAAVVLISMGALLGRTTPIQLLLMALIEIIVYAGNEYLQLEFLKVFSLFSGFWRKCALNCDASHHASTAPHQMMLCYQYYYCCNNKHVHFANAHS